MKKNYYYITNEVRADKRKIYGHVHQADISVYHDGCKKTNILKEPWPYIIPCGIPYGSKVMCGRCMKTWEIPYENIIMAMKMRDWE